MPSTMLDVRKGKKKKKIGSYSLGARIPSKPTEKSTLHTLLPRSQPQ